MKIHGVVFDFNGTLFQDTEMHEAAWRIIAREAFGRSLTDADCAAMHGRSNADLIQGLADTPLSPKEIARIGERKERLYRAMCHEEPSYMRLTDGASQLLDELMQRGIPRAIATASGRENVDFYIHQFDLLRWFRPWHIIYNDGTLPGKPAPDLFLCAMAAIDVMPGRCLVFEDSHQGIQAAVNAGAGAVIAICPKGKQHSIVKIQGVDGILHSFDEVDRSLFQS